MEIVTSMSLTYILFKVVDKLFGLRVSEADEIVGLDLKEHEEAGYEF